MSTSAKRWRRGSATRRAALRGGAAGLGRSCSTPAYKLFPDSKAAKGEKGTKEIEKEASTEQIAFAHLMKGVHW